jgi:hypothetical protein
VKMKHFTDAMCSKWGQQEQIARHNKVTDTLLEHLECYNCYIKENMHMSVFEIILLNPYMSHNLHTPNSSSYWKSKYINIFVYF